MGSFPRFRFLVFGLLTFVCVGPSFAGSFKVNPLALNFDRNTKSVALKLTNTGDQAVTVQMDSMRWTQDNAGEDQYAPTDDILFFPKIVTIEKGEERIVRVGYRGEPPVNSEFTYRFFAQELPSRNVSGGLLNFTLRFSIPIFVKPTLETESMQVTNTKVEQGQAKISVRNSGSRHVLFNRVYASGFDKSQREVFAADTGGWYVLPGVTKTFAVSVDEAACRRAEHVEMTVKSDTTNLSSRVAVPIAECVAKKSAETRLVNQ